MKKLATTLAMILALGTLLAACSGSDNAEGGKDKPTELVISTWGFAEDAMKKNLYEPFEKKYNVKIVTEIGNNTDRLNKIRQGSSKVDLIYLSDYYALQGIEEGLFEKIDRKNIPNIENLYDIAKAPLGQDYGPAHTVAQLGLAYNADEVKEPVDSWEDLWKPAFQNKLALPNITITTGPMLIDMAAKHGGSMDMGTDAAFKALKEINPGVVKYYSKSADLVNMFAQGEVVIAPMQDTFYGSVSEAVPSAKFVTPKEGAYALLNTVNVVKGSKNKELAEKFIDWHLSQEVQQANALDRVDSPTNKLVTLTEEQAAGLTYGADVVENLKTLDLRKVNQEMAEWIDRWNREIE
ncbi:ABC transporter substrate-binding protein [Paenibacillus melissococcoides]|uniref:ABC transporter substrate-binding protein n=1 Tax=Paenibacillus melissococcoides TaxID=2912268 RepID=A0ABM9G849_9BACL|nr:MULTISPECIES: ABC transporter substrate-binding protein [Paenibacillus]MEB9893132.1 ABC transporter substrate-binding protein [Bacillus cereus]CAH8248131.1 ABC transporter substrate-binding protein [Paenibacillus melissococcoides]CAH8718384.1 ABC transporter substrate-binding protein [Paenibacillus melissococcoides]CAH8718736.1 ABC transporter substrate-binding protein [Paenibacillus melissococcoides]GIO78269.1 spermidine/putrescine ABC transporter substrate-binding protein [Paenibacillus d